MMMTDKNKSAFLPSYCLFLTIVSHLMVLPPDSFGLDIGRDDSFYSFFWTRAADDSAAAGYYGLATIGDEGQAESRNASFRMFSGDSWWKDLVSGISTGVTLGVSDDKPDSIEQFSSRFSDVSWINSITGSTDLKSYKIRFFFPVLPKDRGYRIYDHFIIRLHKDTLLQFTAISDSVFVGTFTNDRSVAGGKTTIYAKNALSITTTSKNALRIKTIQIDGKHRALASSYLRFDLDALGSGASYYGLSIIDTSRSDIIFRVESISLQNSPVLPADSLIKVSWSVSGGAHLEACSLFFRAASGAWIYAGKTDGSDTSLSWLVPHIENDSCYLLVKAYGDDYRFSELQSSKFSIAVIEDTTGATGIKYGTGRPAAAVPQAGAIVPANRFHLDGSVTGPASVHLSWRTESEDSDTIDSIAIVRGDFHFPLSIGDTKGIRAGTYAPTDSCCSIDGLPTGRSCYFSLFVRNSTGHWSTSAESARIKLTIGSPSGEPVTLSDNQASLYRDSLSIRPEGKLDAPYHDTILNWYGPEVPGGFIVTAGGIEFLAGTLQANPVRLEFTYRRIPRGFSPTDQRFYRYNVRTGRWRVDFRRPEIDTVHGTVSAAIRDLSLPVIVMIDTTPPRTDTRMNVQYVLRTEDYLVNRFSVLDNIENPSVALLTGPGEVKPRDMSLYMSRENDGYRVNLPALTASGCSGMRAMIVASDGRNFDTMHLKTSIVREQDNCDDFETEDMEWTPMVVTGSAERNRVVSGIRGDREESLFGGYDRNRECIVRRLPGAATHGEWIEYSAEADSLFSFRPGDLSWIKTVGKRTIRFGKAVVPSLADTFGIQLYPGGWTDFSNPFSFDIYLRDIAGSSGDGLFDSLELYRWVKTDNRYHAVPVLLPGMAIPDSPYDFVFGKGFRKYIRSRE